jgi:hypothetical protein
VPTLLKLARLVKLIEDYEEEHYSLQPSVQIAPHKFLQHMMEAREMEPDDLMELFNISRELALLIFNGDRQIDLKLNILAIISTYLPATFTMNDDVCKLEATWTFAIF